MGNHLRDDGVRLLHKKLPTTCECANVSYATRMLYFAHIKVYPSLGNYRIVTDAMALNVETRPALKLVAQKPVRAVSTSGGLYQSLLRIKLSVLIGFEENKVRQPVF